MPASIRTVCAVVLPVFMLPACDVSVGDKGVSLEVSAGRASDSWSRTYTLPAGGQLDVSNINGAINVSAGQDGRVEIKIDRKVQSLTDEAARERLAGTEVVETSTPGAVSVKVQDRRREGGGRRREGPGGLTSEITIKLPPGLVASFSNENGPIRLEQVDGTFNLSTANARIEGVGVSGAVTATAVNGPIDVTMRSVTAPIEFNVVNGQAVLVVPPATKASLVASALNGGITVDDALKFEGTRAAESQFPQRRTEGALNGGGPRISIQAVNGGVRVRAEGSPAK